MSHVLFAFEGHDPIYFVMSWKINRGFIFVKRLSDNSFKISIKKFYLLFKQVDKVVVDKIVSITF